MGALGAWLVGVCVLAQPAGDPIRPNLKAPRLQPRRPAPAAAADTTGDESRSDERPHGRRPAADTSVGESIYEREGVREPAARARDDFERSPRGEGQEHTATGSRKLRPPELLAEAMSSPKAGRLRGQPIPLVDAFAKVSDRAEQRKVAVSYWRLATAQAQYHFALNARDALRHWAEQRHKSSSLGESQLAAAQAAVDDAEVNVIKAGSELAGILGVEEGDHVLWAVDRPHVGDYRSEYERLFAGQTPPPRLRLIHRTLPISRRAIDVHGESVVAAQHALETTEEEYRQGTADYLALSGCFDRLAAERRAFLQSVLRYNEDIADYAFAVAPAAADARLLASMLVKHPAPSARGPASDENVEATPRREAEPPASEGESFPRTFREQGPVDDAPLEEMRTDELRGEDSGASHFRRPAATRLLAGAAVLRRPQMLLVQTGRTHGGLYQGLLNADETERPQKLGELLHWDRELPTDSGEKRTLAACLEHVQPQQRRAVIEAFWLTREHVARYQVLAERSEALTALSSKLLELRSEPGGAAAMMRLAAARQAAHAAVLDEHIRLLTAEYDLTRLAGSPLDQPWILPATVPRVAPVRPWTPDRRTPHLKPPASSVAMLPVLQAELAAQARAVVYVDEFRALITGTDEHRPGQVDTAIAAVDRQLRETQSFLRALTDYNLAVADYTLALHSPAESAKTLADSLLGTRKAAAGG